MRRKIVFGNWKLNGDTVENAALIGDLLKPPAWGDALDVAVFPPCVYLAAVLAQCGGSALQVGAQDASAYRAGAYTGEVSAGMLAGLGCAYALIGHSERRHIFGESDGVVAEKALRCFEAGLVPVVCVGESQEDRVGGRAEAVVARQVRMVLDAVGDRSGGVFAYEPVWAIGSGRIPEPADISGMHQVVRGCADGWRVIYGGSVVAKNADAILALPEVDGVLVGGASLRATEFLAIVQAASRVAR